MKRTLIPIFFLILVMSFQASASWELYEQTNVKGTISGLIKKGTVIEMKSGGVYAVWVGDILIND